MRIEEASVESNPKEEPVTHSDAECGSDDWQSIWDGMDIIAGSEDDDLW